MGMGLAFVLVSNGPGIVSDPVKNHLQSVACELVLRKIDRINVKGDVPFNGIVETEWETKNIGGTTGLLFHSHINDPNGDYQANFIISEQELKKGAQVLQKLCKEMKVKWNYSDDLSSVQHLLNFRNLKRSRQGKSLN